MVAHFVPGVEDFDSSFFGSVAMLLGVVTTLVTTGKALQGFEPKKDYNDKKPLIVLIDHP